VPRVRSETPPALPATVRSLFDAALEHAHAARNPEALRILDELLGLDSTFLKAHSLKACVLMNGGRHEQARQTCERALELDAMCLEACLMLGVIARSEDNDDMAQKRFREAMYQDPDCWLAHYYLAEIHFLRGERGRARAGYESALRILQDPSLLKRGRSLFPLSFKAEPFVHICRHKLALIKAEL
jgi:chemotaxis protein methyltransferase CheR